MIVEVQLPSSWNQESFDVRVSAAEEKARAKNNKILASLSGEKGVVQLRRLAVQTSD